MRLVVIRKTLRRVIPWAERVLLACAVSLLGYCGFVLVDSWIFQRRESQNLERLMDVHRATSKEQPQGGSVPSSGTKPAIGPDGLIGRIEISRLDLSAVVIEGTDKTTLRRAVGHIPSTALPGQPGNVGLAGHRDTFFRPLRNIRENDIVTLTTLRGEYRYRVVSMRVVTPYEVSVLNPSADEVLTLVTCHPFYFIGSAPNRFIVRAERVTGAAAQVRVSETGK